MLECKLWQSVSYIWILNFKVYWNVIDYILFEGYYINLIVILIDKRMFPGVSDGKNLPAKWETQVWPLGQKDPLEKGMATYSSILSWKILWTEEPGSYYSPWGHKELNMTEQLTLIGKGFTKWL